MIEWRPMVEFDPSKPAMVHDGLNDQVVDWKPELYQKHYERYAHPEFNAGVTEWDGPVRIGTDCASPRAGDLVDRRHP
jgi:hypothetical protein